MDRAPGRDDDGAMPAIRRPRPLRLALLALTGLAVLPAVAGATPMRPEGFERTYTEYRNASAFAAVKTDDHTFKVYR